LNSDGKLDISEVKVLLKAGKPSMKDREIEAIFKKVDKTLG
jgi:Ca2+-binding EF-hand superfamily protein